MKLSDGERLIIVMLAEVMEALNLNREVNPTLIKSLVCGGDEWALKRKYSGIFNSEAPSPADVSETTDILWMWGIIEHGLTKLKGEEATEAESWPYAKFGGFDGNNDAHYGIALTMIHELGEFQDFKDRGLNSHSQANLPHYRQMSLKFHDYVRQGKAAPLSFTALKDLCT